MADVTSPRKMRQTHKRRRSEESLAAWSDDSTIQTDVDRLLALEIVVRIRFRGHDARCRGVNATDIYIDMWSLTC